MTSVLFHSPVEEGLAAEHGSELLWHAFEQLLNGCGVANESGGHLEAAGRDVTDGCLDVVWDPLHEVAAVLVLHIQHLFVHFLHGHFAPKDGGDSKVAPAAWVTSCHHVFGVKHLLSEFRNCQCPGKRQIIQVRFKILLNTTSWSDTESCLPTCTSGCPDWSGGQSLAWKSAAWGRAPCSQPVSSDRHWAGRESAGRWSPRSWWMRQGGLDHHRSV